MPQPQPNEAKQDFLKRCTADLVSNEGRPADQAFAVCNAYWDDARSERQAMNLAAPVEFQAAGEETPPGFLITAYTGAVIDRGFFGSMVIDVNGIKTKAKMPILREHQRDRVVGYAAKAWLSSGNLLIRGDYSQKTADAREVRDLGAEGFPWQASIGVWPKKVKVLESPDETMTVNGQEMAGPLEVWTESEVKEVSFVALGADDNTAAINFSDGPAVKVKIERGQTPINKEVKMDLTLAVLENEAPELLKEIRETARLDGQRLERERVVEILAAEGDATVALQAITDGVTAADAYKQFYQAEKAKRGQALADLEASAPQPLGQTPPEPPASQEAPEQQLDRLARELAAAKKISLDAAMLEVAQDHPELIRRWNPASLVQ